MVAKLKNSAFWKALEFAQRTILWVASLVLVVITTLSVVARYVLKVDIYGLEEMIIFGIIYIYFIGGAYATCTKDHITGDALAVIVNHNPTILHAARIIVAIISLAVSTFFTVWGINYVKMLIKLPGATPALHIPYIIGRGVMAVAFALMFFYCLVDLIDVLTEKAEPQKENENNEAEEA